MTGYNVNLLTLVRDQIKNHPESHDQGTWGHKSYSCKTTYCVAGWACALSEVQIKWYHDYGNVNEETGTVVVDGKERGIPDYAQEVLGLNLYERITLFDGANSQLEVLDMLDELIEAGSKGEKVN